MADSTGAGPMVHRFPGGGARPAFHLRPEEPEYPLQGYVPTVGDGLVGWEGGVQDSHRVAMIPPAKRLFFAARSSNSTALDLSILSLPCTLAGSGPMTKSQAQHLAYAQHPATRGNTLLHRAAGLGDPTPVVEARLSQTARQQLLKSQPLHSPQPSHRPTVHGSYDGSGHLVDVRQSPSPIYSGRARASASRRRSRSAGSPLGNNGQRGASRSPHGEPATALARSPADKLRAASGNDIVIPEYVDNESWSWAARRRRGGVGTGPDAGPGVAGGSTDAILLAGPAGSDGFLGWPPADANACNAAGETALHRAAGCRGEAAPLARPPSGGGRGICSGGSGGGGALSVMGHLMALGADPGARDARGLTPMMTVMVKGERLPLGGGTQVPPNGGQEGLSSRKHHAFPGLI